MPKIRPGQKKIVTGYPRAEKEHSRTDSGAPVGQQAWRTAKRLIVWHLSATHASRVAPSSRRTRALGKRRLSLVISSPTSGAISSATPTNRGDGASTSGFSRQYFRTEALGA